MIDDTKVRYLEGKYMEMQDEINTVINSSGLESFNRERYQSILVTMNVRDHAGGSAIVPLETRTQARLACIRWFAALGREIHFEP